MTIGDFFDKELKGRSFPPEVLAGELEQIGINRGDRSMEVFARFSQFVEYPHLQQLAKALAGSALRRVQLLPRFPAESFSPERLDSGPGPRGL